MQTKSKSPLMEVLTTQAFWMAMAIKIVATMGRSCISQPATLLGSELGLTASAIGILTSCYTVCSMLIATPFGSLMDKTTKPKMYLCISNLMFAVVCAGYGFCNSVPMFVALRLLHGFCFGMSGIATSIIVTMTVDRKALGTAFGLMALFPKIVSSVTTKITLWVKATAGMAYVSYAGAILCTIAAVLCLFLKIDRVPTRKPRPAREKGKLVKSLIYLPALPLLMVSLFQNFPSLASTFCIVLYGKEVGMDSAAATFASCTSLFMGISSFVCGLLIDKIQDRKTARIFTFCTMLVACLGGVMVSRSTNEMVWLASGILCGIGAGSNICKVLVLREADPSVLGLIQGTFSIGASIVSVISSTMLGVMADSMGYANTYFIISLFPLVGAVMVLFFYDKLLDLVSKDKRTDEAVVAESTEAKA